MTPTTWVTTFSTSLWRLSPNKGNLFPDHRACDGPWAAQSRGELVPDRRTVGLQNVPNRRSVHWREGALWFYGIDTAVRGRYG